MLQAYTTKVQPRSSAARTEIRMKPDMASRHCLEFASLDKIDWEAGGILIALAQDRGPWCWGDNEDVITEDVKGKEMDVPKMPCLMDSRHDANTSNGSSTCSNASESSTNSSTSSGQMSIRHLLGGDDAADDGGTLTSTPPLQNDSQPSADKAASPAPKPAPKSDWKHCERTDPILLLAAAAAAVDNEDKQRYKRRSYERREISIQPRRSLDYSNTQITRPPITKRKYEHNTHQSSPPNRPIRHPYERRPHSPIHHPTAAHWPQEDDTDTAQPSDNASRWHYLSMKQNPRIKRNAMHAYITYMIYTDMAADERSRTGRKKMRDETSVGRGPYHYQHTMREQEGLSPGLDSPAMRLPATSQAPPPPPPPAPTRMNHYEPTSWYTNNNAASYGMPPSPRQQHHRHLEPTILSRPLTAHLWDSSPSDNVVLPPLPTFDRAHRPR